MAITRCKYILHICIDVYHMSKYSICICVNIKHVLNVNIIYRDVCKMMQCRLMYHMSKKSTSLM